MLYETKKTIRLIETVFDIFYISAVAFLTVLLISSSTPFTSSRWLFGILVFFLLFGDSFHLIPRIIAMWKKPPQPEQTKNSKLEQALGLGKMVTSITLTIFYLGLWFLGIYTYMLHGTQIFIFTIIVIVLAVIRVFLCLLPQNHWLSDGATTSWIIIRNIPFFMMGIAVIVLYSMCSAGLGQFNPIDVGLSYLWLVILISFVFYVPVLLWGKKYPKLGILMLPKSCAYVLMIIMGFAFPLN